MNLVTIEGGNERRIMFDNNATLFVRLWFAVFFIVSFLCIAASEGIALSMIREDSAHLWPAFAGGLQTILIFLSSMVFLFARALS